jgi:hypothetical protein
LPPHRFYLSLHSIPDRTGRKRERDWNSDRIGEEKREESEIVCDKAWEGVERTRY